MHFQIFKWIFKFSEKPICKFLCPIQVWITPNPKKALKKDYSLQENLFSRDINKNFQKSPKILCSNRFLKEFSNFRKILPCWFKATIITWYLLALYKAFRNPFWIFETIIKKCKKLPKIEYNSIFATKVLYFHKTKWASLKSSNRISRSPELITWTQKFFCVFIYILIYDFFSYSYWTLPYLLPFSTLLFLLNLVWETNNSLTKNINPQIKCINYSMRTFNNHHWF